MNGVRTGREVAMSLGLAVVLFLSFQLYGPLNHGPARWSVRTPIDDILPLAEPFVLAYLSIYVLGALTFVAFWLMSARLLSSTLIASILTLGASYSVYFAAQTFVARPIILGDDPFSEALRFVYAADEPFNAFPSLHVGLSMVMAVHWWWSRRRIGIWIVLWCGVIGSSTLFVRQHYVADVVAGLVVGGLACLLSRKIIDRLRVRPTAGRPTTRSGVPC